MQNNIPSPTPNINTPLAGAKTDKPEPLPPQPVVDPYPSTVIDGDSASVDDGVRYEGQGKPKMVTDDDKGWG